MYTIRSGDTLNGIAQRHGVSVQALLGVNPQVKNPSVIFAGGSLRIPAGSAAPAAAPALRRGATGQAVRELQRKLQVLGQLSAADVASGPGVFGPRTEAALMAFQSRNGIKRTGIAGGYTQAALARAISTRTLGSTRNGF